MPEFIYRLTDETGEGVYRSAHEFVPTGHFLAEDRPATPATWSDRLRDGRLLERVVTRGIHVFGFASVRQAREWFPPSYVREWSERGLLLRVFPTVLLPDGPVYTTAHQAVFEPGPNYMDFPAAVLYDMSAKAINHTVRRELL